MVRQSSPESLPAGLSGGTLASTAVPVPPLGFTNEAFAILTDQNFTAVGSITATFTWSTASHQQFFRLDFLRADSAGFRKIGALLG